MPLKSLIFLLLTVLILGSFKTETTWEPLLDKKLSKWEMYLSYRHKDGYKGEPVVDSNGQPVAPVGYNKNENNVFSVQDENGETVLRISGEIYGCVFTRKEYENYHLKLLVKWGTKKWEPRLNEARDSGILYHSQGKCGGDYWQSWMLSQELQIIENSIGDYWNIAGSQMTIRADQAKGKSHYVYNSTAAPRKFGSEDGQTNFCQAGEDAQLPGNQWNKVELICFGDKSVYVVNDKVVMSLSNSGYVSGGVVKPLTKGKLQLQSEAAEVFFKDVLIRPITKMPAQYTHFFE